MLKHSIHIWHWCISLCQIAILLQKDGDCDAWTESSPHYASLSGLKPCALIYQTEREVTADMICLPNHLFLELFHSQWQLVCLTSLHKREGSEGFCILPLSHEHMK